MNILNDNNQPFLKVLEDAVQQQLENGLNNNDNKKKENHNMDISIIKSPFLQNILKDNKREERKATVINKRRDEKEIIQKEKYTETDNMKNNWIKMLKS